MKKTHLTASVLLMLIPGLFFMLSRRLSSSIIGDKHRFSNLTNLLGETQFPEAMI